MKRKKKAGTEEKAPVPVRVRRSNEELCVMIQQGDRAAARQLCLQTRNMVKAYAKQMCAAGHRGILTNEDLVQAGMQGVLIAAKRYDPERGTQFSTFATPWIRNFIRLELAEGGYPIKLPVKGMDQLWKSMKAEGTENSGPKMHAPDAKETEWEKRWKVRARENLLRMDSLDRPLETEDGAESEITVGESHIQSPWDRDDPHSERDPVAAEAEENRTRRIVADAVGLLPERECRVIQMRYGFVSDTPMTLEEIAKKLNISREWARQLHSKAMRKLQDNPELQNLWAEQKRNRSGRKGGKNDAAKGKGKRLV